MIVYFSGTGNSRFVAEELARLLGESVVCMDCDGGGVRALEGDEGLGIVFPVYAWGLPAIVGKWLKGMDMSGERYVWTAMTCGDDMGYTDVVLERVIGRRVNAAFSLQMPNTYVCLPGFDVDSPELAASKVTKTQEMLPRIAEVVGARGECRELTRGGLAWMKTYVLRPLFNGLLVTDRFFRASDNCSSCGLCARECPTKDIVMAKGRPSWLGGECTGCLRCFHRCHRRAIDWGRFTKGKKSNLHVVRLPRGVKV